MFTCNRMEKIIFRLRTVVPLLATVSFLLVATFLVVNITNPWVWIPSLFFFFLLGFGLYALYDGWDFYLRMRA